MLVVGKYVLCFSLGILLGILIEKWINCLISQREPKNNYYYDSLDDFYYSEKFDRMINNK